MIEINIFFFVLEYEDQILQSITIEFKSSTSLHFFVYRTKEYYEVSNIKFYKIIPLPLFIDCLFFLFTFLQETEYPDTQIWLSQNEFVIEQKYYKLRLKKDKFILSSKGIILEEIPIIEYEKLKQMELINESNISTKLKRLGFDYFK